MKTVEKNQIAQALKSYKEKHNATLKELQVKTGVRYEIMSAIVNNKFSYSVGSSEYQILDNHFLNIAKGIGFNVKKALWTTRETSQLTTMIPILEDAKEHSYTRLIIGETGSGKSYTMNLFTKAHPTDVFKVIVGSTDNLRDILTKVGDAIGVPLKSSNSAKIRTISKRLKVLKNRGKKPMLIFDEAENLKPAALRSIKEFYDQLEKDCSIILIGTNQLLDQLERLRKRDSRGIPQLCRRIKFGIIHLPEINTRFNEFLAAIEDKEVINFIRTNCNNYGELHDVLVPCIREAERLEQPLTISLVKQVLNIEFID